MAEEVAFTKHALDMLKERNLDKGSIENIVPDPDHTIQDSEEIWHAIHKDGERYLRVVVKGREKPYIAVTTYYDRRLRKETRKPLRGTLNKTGLILSCILYFIYHEKIFEKGGTSMRVKVDLESDALYFRISEESIEESEEVSPGIVIDYNSDGKMVGIEVLGIKERFSMDELSQFKVDLPTMA